VRAFSFVILFLASQFSMSQPSRGTFYALRLKPHDDLKKELMRFAEVNRFRAASIVTCVGSLEQINLRFANQEKGTIREGFFEIVSLTGTLSATGCHLHLSVSDSTGQTAGGHLLDDNWIYTTAEIVLVELTDLEFERETDSTYGYQGLSIRKRKKK
jgi:predicted DNA-binding protein with PD1-like motif